MPEGRKGAAKDDLNEGPRRKGTLPVKDPLAVELGRRGGLKGGKARAKKLSAKKRSEIARRAAIARWKR